jgi:hypothetical protein
MDPVLRDYNMIHEGSIGTSITVIVALFLDKHAIERFCLNPTLLTCASGIAFVQDKYVSRSRFLSRLHLSTVSGILGTYRHQLSRAPCKLCSVTVGRDLCRPQPFPCPYHSSFSTWHTNDFRGTSLVPWLR